MPFLIFFLFTFYFLLFDILSGNCFQLHRIKFFRHIVGLILLSAFVSAALSLLGSSCFFELAGLGPASIFISQTNRIDHFSYWMTIPFAPTAQPYFFTK